MANVKVTAELLEMSGWTEAQIDRYYKLLKRQSVHGLKALSVVDRRFYLSASVAANKAAAELDKVIKSAQKRAVSGKQPVETKLHYRWVAAEIEMLPRFAELAIGEVLAHQIWSEEILRALSIYQPVLDQIDTSKRGAFNAPFAELMELADGIGRRVQFDHAGFMAGLRETFPENWNSKWEAYYTNGSDTALTGDDIVEFRALVRPVVESLTRETYPSVVNTVAV